MTKPADSKQAIPSPEDRVTTQSVCKHCQQPESDVRHWSGNFRHHFEPVAEPASTSPESNVARVAGVIAEALHKTDPLYRAARPSAPSAPQASAEPYVSYEQVILDQRTKEVGYIAAPQPVSGDAPSPTPSVSTEPGAFRAESSLSPVETHAMLAMEDKNMIATIIANEFSKQLRQQLTAEQMEEVIRLNAAELDKVGICHTHDFCDGNEIMLHALEALGIERISDELWNEAWSIAKGAGFTPAPSVAGTQPTCKVCNLPKFNVWSTAPPGTMIYDLPKYFCNCMDGGTWGLSNLPSQQMTAHSGTVNPGASQGTPQVEGTPEPPKVEELAATLAKRIATLALCTHEGCNTIDILRCNIERLGTDAIIKTLRPYFPPASQKIIGLARDFLIATGQFTPFDPNATYAVTGQQVVHIINQFVAQLNIADRVAATPASTARTDGQLYVISVTGDGGQTTIVPESLLKSELHKAYCSCGKDWQKCSDEVVTNTIAKLDDAEEWTQNYPSYERHIWLDHGEDYTVQVMRVSAPGSVPQAEPPKCLVCKLPKLTVHGAVPSGVAIYDLPKYFCNCVDGGSWGLSNLPPDQMKAHSGGREPFIVVNPGHKRECASNLRIAVTQGINSGCCPSIGQDSKPVYVPIPECNCGAAQPGDAPQKEKP